MGTNASDRWWSQWC